MKLLWFILVFLYHIHSYAADKTILSYSQFHELSAEHKKNYILIVRKYLQLSELAGKLDKSKNITRTSKKYSTLINFIQSAHADENSLAGIKCLVAGNVSHLEKRSNGRVMCKNPKSESCGDAKLQCNPVLYGKNKCVTKSSLASFNFLQKADPIDKIVSDLSPADWKEIEEIDLYCQKPLGFQKKFVRTCSNFVLIF